MKKLSVIIALFALFIQALSAQTDDEAFEPAMAGAEIRAAFFDKTLYFPELGEENPIFVKITIANKGTGTVRFKLANDRMFSVDFRAVNPRNSPLKNTAECLQKRSSPSTVFFREIALEPGEEYSFVENIKNYVQIDLPSVYYVEARFFPELIKSAVEAQTATKDSFLLSNRLVCEVKPYPGAAKIAGLTPAVMQAQIEGPQSISPDKVIEKTIIARQKGLWDQFFIYMDIEQMLVADPVCERRYRNESAASRAQMLESYKIDMMQSRIDRDIAAIPSKFQIERTTYTQTEGTVSAIEYFSYNTFSEKKRYTYRMRQRDGIWRICGYSVDNLGTE